MRKEGAPPSVVLSEIAQACTLIHAASTGDLDAVIQSQVAGVPLDCTDYDQRTPLHLAAAEGHKEIVSFLLAQGIDPRPKDRWGATPADSALRHKRWEIVKLLAHAQANAHRPAERADGEKALTIIQAASAGDLEVLRYTALAGASLDCADYDGRTPLHLAAAEGHAEVVAFLLEQGVRPDPADRWGATPADSAAERGRADIVSMLKAWRS